MPNTEREPGVFFTDGSTGKTRQQDDIMLAGVIEPPIPFYSLEKAYDDSYIIGGIFDKLATAANSGFKPTKNAEMDKVLKRLNLKSLFENILVFGNAFLEKVKGGNGQIIDLVPFLTQTVYVWSMNQKKAYLQQVSGKQTFFLPEEIVHFKTTSTKTKHYGESKFSKAVAQIVLLAQIDQYYSNQFDRGMLNVSLLTETGDVKLSDEKVKQLVEWLRNSMSGVQNAFKTSYVQAKLERLDLEKEVDAKAFIEYRRELQESVAIALNIPIDMLTSRNSNRATSDTAFKVLIDIIVRPMQEDFLRDIKEQLLPEFGASVEDIDFFPVVIVDEKQDMEIYTGYKKSGIMTANEVRAKLGLPEHPDGNKLETAGVGQKDQAAMVAKEVEDIKKSISHMYDEQE